MSHLPRPLSLWTLKFRHFKEAIRAQVMQRHALDHPLDSELEAYLRTQLPLEEEVLTAFHAYRTRALAIKDLLSGEELKVAWTRLLHRLPPSFGVRFDGPSLETVKDLIVNWPVVSDCVLRPHDHDLDHEVGPCLNAAAHVGTALFATGIACLAEAKTSILGLNISCAMDKDFGWDRLPAWKQLDLSGLYGFVFNPYLQIRYQEINVRDEYFPIAHNASAAVDMVLEKSRKSLEDFEYGPNCPQHWPGPDVISLPELRHLELHGGWLRPTNLKDWIASMPVLENIALVCIMQDEEDSVTGWRHVLDAIRNHENGIQIEFDYLEQESELSREWILNDSPPLDFHTSDPSRYRAMKVEPGSWLEFKRSLALYLSGEGDFDQVLIDGFKKDG